MSTACLSNAMLRHVCSRRYGTHVQGNICWQHKGMFCVHNGCILLNIAAWLNGAWLRDMNDCKTGVAWDTNGRETCSVLAPHQHSLSKCYSLVTLRHVCSITVIKRILQPHAVWMCVTTMFEVGMSAMQHAALHTVILMAAIKPDKHRPLKVCDFLCEHRFFWHVKIG